MSESVEDSAESLLHLFSAKARVPKADSKIIPLSKSSHGESAPVENTQQKSKLHRNIQGHFNSNTKITSLIREARRELGRDYSQKQSGPESVIDEEQIAGAIDRVLKKRSDTLSDVQRADLIVHLKQALTGWGILQRLIRA